jgi:hypothetical protein
LLFECIIGRLLLFQAWAVDEVFISGFGHTEEVRLKFVL